LTQFGKNKLFLCHQINNSGVQQPLKNGVLSKSHMSRKNKNQFKMKSKIIVFAFLLLGLTAGFSGCKKEEPAPAKTTGGLVVKVKLDGSTGYLTGAEVGLATSQANLDNSIYLQDKVTDATGQVNFGQLNPANYYYDCATTIAGTDYYGEGQIQIVAGTDLELTLTIK
jgi:hypothetical protein